MNGGQSTRAYYCTRLGETLEEMQNLGNVTFGVDEGEHDRLKRLHEVTADHLRKARRELATLRYDLEEAGEVLQLWHGSSSRYDVSRTPEHYRGDGLVTCSRAMESAASQQGASELPNMAVYWWGCALKYVWRMWSKGDPESDAEKACDCIRKAVRAWRAER